MFKVKALETYRIANTAEFSVVPRYLEGRKAIKGMRKGRKEGRKDIKEEYHGRKEERKYGPSRKEQGKDDK
jgi:hypothetical protein